MKFDAFGTSKNGEGKSLSRKIFATLISTLGRFNRANKKKICHIHFNLGVGKGWRSKRKKNEVKSLAVRRDDGHEVRLIRR